MAQNQYSPYRGRKPWGRRILIAIVVILIIALVAAVGAYFFLRDRVVFTDEGPQLVLPFGRESAAPTSAPTPTAPPLPPEEELVVEPPADTPAPSETPTAAPAPAPGFVAYPRRSAPLGLRPLEEGEELEARQGAIEAVRSLEELYERHGTDADAIREGNQSLPYAAVVVLCGGGDDAGEEFRAGVIETCTVLAGLGFDEIVLREEEGGGGTASQMDGFYARLRAAVDELGYEGRLSAVCTQSTFFDGRDEATGQSAQAVADHFDRVYVPGGSWGDYNLYQSLKAMGFRGSTADIVTIVRSPMSANYAWAVLPR